MRTMTTSRPSRTRTRPGANARDRRSVRTFARGKGGSVGVWRFQPRSERVISLDCRETEAEVSTLGVGKHDPDPGRRPAGQRAREARSYRRNVRSVLAIPACSPAHPTCPSRFRACGSASSTTPLPADGGRSRALVSQRRRATRRGRARSHLSDAAPAGTSRQSPTSPACESSRSARGWRSTQDGRRRILPPLVFGLGVLWHLIRHGRRYDVVHTRLVPVLLAARGGVRAAACPVPHRRRLARALDARLLARVPRAGSAGGRLARAATLPARSAARLLLLATARAAAARRGSPRRGDRARGPVRGDAGRRRRAGRAGRRLRGTAHPREAVPAAVVHAVAQARETIPELRGAIYGDGPERPEVLAAIAEHGLEDVVEAPGFVDEAVIEDALARALCLVLPSRREGYGLVVVEALAKGTPSVRRRAARTTPRPSSSRRASTASSRAGADPEDLAAAIVARRTRRASRCASRPPTWFARQRGAAVAGRASLERSPRSLRGRARGR